MTHADRRRADSFGSAAERYDRARPRYPNTLLHELLERKPRTVLDVGCGTGIASAALAARGCLVLGVEPDERMASIARRKGLEVEVSRFEEWDPQGRRFDLLVSGQAWHWVEPHAGLEAAARCVVPGGSLALFWNIGTPAEDMRPSLDQVYATTAPDMDATVALGGIARSAWTDHAAALTAQGHFVNAATRSYEWSQEYSAVEWVELISTHSDHALLPEPTRTALLDGVQSAIVRNGGRLDVSYTTVLVRAQRTID